ncbi:MAG: glycosyltransferase family 4 protein [Candidatus Scalindua sp.]|nr:glycosyltransferase family 4 protein [Candidatus Scalindua sp.]
MKIAIDARMVGPYMHGISRYAYNLIKGIAEAGKSDQYVLITNDNFLDEFVSAYKNFSLRIVRSRLYGIWEQFEIPRTLRAEKIDIFHSPSFFGPISGESKVIMTIHDMIHVLFPEESSVFHKIYYKMIVERAAANASKVLTVSENSKRDIVKYLNVSPEKIVVTYNAVEKKFRQSNEDKVEEVKRRFGINGRFILYVGNQKPHKNVRFLIDAYGQLKGKINHLLVIVGQRDKLFQKSLRELELEGVTFLSDVPDDLLPYIYSGADVFITPSLYEGFGLPIVEAFACETPVIAVDTLCSAEIMGNAGLRVDAGSVDELASVIYNVLTDDGLRSRLVKQGLTRVKKFSWDETVDRTLGLYDEVYKARSVKKREALHSSSLSYKKSRRIRIGINASKYSDVHTGVGRFTNILCHHISELNSNYDFYMYTAIKANQLHKISGRNVRIRRAGLNLQSNISRILWEQVALPYYSSRDELDLFHYTDHALSVMEGVRPCIITVHDIAFILFPHLFNRTRRMYKKFIFERLINKADIIITPSNSTKNDLKRYCEINEEKIKVVHYGVEKRFLPISKSKVEGYRSRNSLPSRMILSVGTLEPRKNIVTLIKAFAKLREKGFIDYKLVVAGSKGWLYKEIFKEIGTRGLQKEVLFLGNVADEDLPNLYNCADLFVYPSLYEGFGLPPLEAMACGVPVITSNTSSLPEVVGDAGIMVDPTDVNSLFEKMCQILGDSELRHYMKNMGLERAKLFSWRKTAKGIMEIYDDTLKCLNIDKA